ncbi:MAG: PP2C family protein-serine/threonine phosphatase [Chloroflexi bacterium]|nr:PP2C family protein-serine/threonine phosphatase [Chloroflexota bacterium]
MILPSILASQHKHLTTLAQDWLDSGASSFSVWADDALLVAWPSDKVSNASLVKAIQVNAVKIGELRLAGLSSPADCQRLEAQAGLIAQIARLERDLNSMGADLIDTQDQLLALYDLTQATRNYLDAEQMLTRLAFETARLVKAEAAFFLVHMKGRSPIIQFYPQPILSEEALQQAIGLMKASRHEFLISRSGAGEQVKGVRNMLLVPIKVRDAETAVMGMLNKLDDDFNSPDIKLAGAIAEFTGAQIENVIMHQVSREQTRLQTEMDLAQRIQIHLLPQTPPGIAGLDLWAASWPASRVGGDFYDFIIGADQPFTFTVGDISGKGIPAALLMAMTRTVIRTKTRMIPRPTPQDVMSRSNQELYDDFTKLSMFATIFVGQYDSIRRQLLYANAGHSPVIYCPAGGEARLLQADGVPMGILPTSLSKDQWIDFQPGDVLVVATDGFSEARSAQDKEFGYDRFVSLVQSLAPKSARAIAEGLYQTVLSFSSGMSQADDQTLVVLKGVGA